MNGKKSLTRFRDRATAVLAAAGVIAMTTGFLVMAVASPAQAVPDRDPKVTVCKYVANDEGTFATYHHLVNVSQSSIDDGTAFNDRQPSLVIGPNETCPATIPLGNATAAVQPVVQSPECGVEGSYTIPSTPGVTYRKDGTTILEGTYPGPASGTITAVVTGNYTLTNPTFSLTFNILASDVCPGYVRAVDPQVDESSACGVQGSFTIPDTEGVQYFLDDEPIEADTYDGPASGKVTAEAKDDLELTNPLFEYELNLPAARTNCGGGGSSSLDSTAVNPDVDQAGPCEVEGSYTIPNTTGVDYFLDGAAIPAGTYDGPESGTITAAAEEGYDLTNDGFTYDLDVEAAEDCPVVAPTDVCPNIAGNQTNVPAGMDKVRGECAEVAGTETDAPKPDKKPLVKGTEAVPTAVAAGIGGSGPTMTGSSPMDLLAQMLVGGGLALLMAAGWLQIGRQTHGVHQV